MYLNCPFCPSQSFLTPATDKFLELGFGLTKFRCSLKHEFYIETEEEDERYRPVRPVHEG